MVGGVAVRYVHRLERVLCSNAILRTPAIWPHAYDDTRSHMAPSPSLNAKGMRRPILDHGVQDLIDQLAARGERPVYSLSPDEARRASVMTQAVAFLTGVLHGAVSTTGSSMSW